MSGCFNWIKRFFESKDQPKLYLNLYQFNPDFSGLMMDMKTGDIISRDLSRLIVRNMMGEWFADGQKLNSTLLSLSRLTFDWRGFNITFYPAQNHVEVMGEKGCYLDILIGTEKVRIAPDKVLSILRESAWGMTSMIDREGIIFFPTKEDVNAVCPKRNS